MLGSMGKSERMRHECGLNQGSESHLPRLPPNASIWARLKRRLQKVLIVSANHPFTRHYLRSKAAIVYEKRRHGISSTWHYLLGFFAIDFVSAVPYTWFHMEMLEEPGPDSKLHLLVFEMLTLLKLCRLSTVQKYIKQIVMDAEGFVFNTRLYKRSDVYIYLTSLYMGGGNLCSYSFTEFSFADFPDKVTRSILLLCGMGYFLSVIVLVLQLVDSSCAAELKYQSIMHGIKDYIDSKKLPKALKQRLLHFYEHRFQGSLFKESVITSTLSNHLKREIIHHSSLKTLASIPLFYNIHRSLIKKIIGALKQVIFLPGDIIFKYNDDATHMYFIVTGTVALITRSGKELRHATDGDFFGEVALVSPDHKRLRTAIALQVCEVLRLNRRDFQRLVPITSELYRRLLTRCMKTKKEIEIAENKRAFPRHSTSHVNFANTQDEDEEDENEEDENEEESEEDENEDDDNNDDNNDEDNGYNGNGNNENINNTMIDSITQYSLKDFDHLLNTAV